jgi:hypothetical protein
MRRFLRSCRLFSKGADAGNESTLATSVATAKPSGDAASYALLYDEAVRSLAAQEASVDELRSRSGVMLSAGGVVAAFLASAALTAVPNTGANSGTTAATPTDPRVLYFAIMVAVALTIVSSAIFVAILRTTAWKFHPDTKSLLTNYIEADEPASLAEIHRSLAWYMDEALDKNRSTLDRLYRAFNGGAILFVAEMVVWFLILAVRFKP